MKIQQLLTMVLLVAIFYGVLGTEVQCTTAEARTSLSSLQAEIDAVAAENAAQQDQIDSLAALSLDTIVIEDAGPGLVCVTCPVDHPFMTGGACERDFTLPRGFGPSTTIDTSTYCCESVGSTGPVIVTAVCAELQ